MTITVKKHKFINSKKNVHKKTYYKTGYQLKHNFSWFRLIYSVIVEMSLETIKAL